MSKRRDLGSISTRLRRIGAMSRVDLGRSLQTLAHFIDKDFLYAASGLIRKDGAAGIDGVTWEGYSENLDANLEDLHERFKSGRYRAPPVRRVRIPKGDGEDRPIGIPTLEDKVLQRAVSMVLSAVYEEEFLDCSFGFRPGRSAHQALEHLQNVLWSMGGGVVLEVDISNFFEELDHGHLQSFLERRVRDGVLRRTINKWLRAGVLEDGELARRDQGTPQGGVISPLLANVYLHEVLDRWFQEEVQPRLKGRAELVRYADDFVFAFADLEDARRVQEVLAKRLDRFGLRVHPDKTRLVQFGRPVKGRGKGPGSFDFLGFRLYWGRSQKGQPIIKWKTAPKPFRRVLRRTNKWCRRHRHQRVQWQWERLGRSLNGHYAYYGITHNSQRLNQLYHQVRGIWKKWLSRRSQRGMTWKRFYRLHARYPLPRPRIVHSYLSIQESLARSRMR